MQLRRQIVRAAIAVVIVRGLLGGPGRHETAFGEGDVMTAPAPADDREPPLRRTDAEWKKLLTRQQFRITRKKGTERAFSGAYWNTKTAGTYHCCCCGKPLFRSEAKFDSGTGWPSFWQPIRDTATRTAVDRSLFTRRTEVLCRHCDAHLGHVFDDGPRPTGLRYCINSASLKLTTD